MDVLTLQTRYGRLPDDRMLSRNGPNKIKVDRDILVGLQIKKLGFTYLKNFDLDRLKIDRSFIRNITSSKGDAAIVRSIVQLARNFGIQTVAEGVETEEALKIVRRSGCDHVQGFLIASPMPAETIPAFIENRRMLIGRTEFASLEARHLPPNLVQ